MKVILGSSSPRRKEIFSYFNIPFVQAVSYFDEMSVKFEGDPIEYCLSIAEKKAEKLSDLFPNDLIITADTVVYCQNRLLNKPSSREEAYEMLSFLSGKTNQVYTGVCVWEKGVLKSDYEISHVQFNSLTSHHINLYLNKNNYLDKSGSYTIQGFSSLLVKNINGCFYNIAGLPIAPLHHLLKEFGIDLWESL